MVVGLARNCSRSVKSEIHKICSAIGPCVSLHWLVIESDSNDGTQAKLEQLRAEVQNFRFITLGNLRESLPLRTDRIAHCRNTYLDEIQRSSVYRDVDFVIVCDLDGVNDLLTTSAFLSCFDKADWDVVTANQRAPDDDIWALRHPDWSPNDCWRQYKFLVGSHVNHKRALFAAVQSKMITIDENSNWIEVDSGVWRLGDLSEGRTVRCDRHWVN